MFTSGSLLHSTFPSCLLLCHHRFISLSVPANFLLVSINNNRAMKCALLDCSPCTMYGLRLQKPSFRHVFSERTASCYSDILSLTSCPSSKLRLENFQKLMLMLRPRSTPKLFKLWLPIYPPATPLVDGTS